MTRIAVHTVIELGLEIISASLKKDKNNPEEAVVEWMKQLKNPLRVQLVEEVDERVSRSVHEVYMDDGKSGWEERETSKH